MKLFDLSGSLPSQHPESPGEAIWSTPAALVFKIQMPTMSPPTWDRADRATPGPTCSHISAAGAWLPVAPGLHLLQDQTPLPRELVQ